MTDTGEVTEVGKAYAPAGSAGGSVLSSLGCQGWRAAATGMEQLAQEMLNISHHPSLGSVAQVGGVGWWDPVGRAGGQKASKSSFSVSKVAWPLALSPG